MISNQEIPSMDNPPIVTWNILSVGDSFVFKGDYCTVTKITNNGFHYNVQNSEIKCWMTFSFYKTTPSFKSRQRNKFNTN